MTPSAAGLRSSRSRASKLDSIVRSYLDHLAVERGVATNTLKSYRRDLDRYLAYLGQHGHTSIAGVDALAVSGFLAYLREGDDEHPAVVDLVGGAGCRGGARSAPIRGS